MVLGFLQSGPQGLPLGFLVPKLEEQFLRPGVEFVGLLGAGHQVPLGGLVVQTKLISPGPLFVQLVTPQGDLQHLQFLPKGQVLLGGLRLGFQGLPLELQFFQLVGNAQKVFLGALQLSLGLFLLVAAVRDARCLLKNLPPLGALGGQDLVDLTLADEGVALLPQAGVHEEFVHIPQADLLIVQVVLALPGPIVPADDGDLLPAIGQNTLHAVQSQGHLGKALAFPPLGTAEDHVLHLAPSELTGGLLSQDPADGIGNVGLSAAVGAYDGGERVVKGEDSLVGKGLESL